MASSLNLTLPSSEEGEDTVLLFLLLPILNPCCLAWTWSGAFPPELGKNGSWHQDMLSPQCSSLKPSKSSSALTPSLVKAPRTSCPGCGEVLEGEIGMEGKGWKHCCTKHILQFPAQADSEGMGSPPSSQLHSHCTSKCHSQLQILHIALVSDRKEHRQPSGEQTPSRTSTWPTPGSQQGSGTSPGSPMLVGNSCDFPFCTSLRFTSVPRTQRDMQIRSSQCSWQLGHQPESCFVFRTRPKCPVMKT